jgi:Domain of unknown function (DUF4383)
MAKTLGILFGIVFLAVGILGFVPGITKDDMLLGIFMVNKVHSIVHIASGAVFLFASMAGAGAASLWFKIFGLVYAVVAVLGFMNPNGMLLGMISNNPADTWLHVVLAAAMLLIGFAAPKSAATV